MLGTVRFLVPANVLRSINAILRNSGKGVITVNQRSTFRVLALNSDAHCCYQGCYESKAFPLDSFKANGRILASFSIELSGNFQFPICKDYAEGEVFFFIDMDYQRISFDKTGISADPETEMSFG